MAFGTDYNYITEEEFNTISGSVIDYIDDEATSVSGALQDDLDQKSDSDHTHNKLLMSSKVIALTDATLSDTKILWSEDDVKDNIYSHTTGSGDITTLSGGDYEIYYNLQWENADVDAVINITNIIVNDNYVIPLSTSYAYSPSSVLPNASNLKSLVHTFSENDYFSLTISGSPTPSDWFDSSWDYKKKIIIDNTKVSGSANHTDFPVLINTTDADWKHTGSGGNVGKNNGGDILFTSSDGTTQLKHEIQEYVSTTGKLIAWVKVPTLDYNDDTEIYIYYGNSGAADQEDPTNVWDSSFAMVQHMDGASDTAIDDSTSNNNDVTSYTGDPTYEVTGKIGKAVDFDGSDALNIPDSTSLSITGNLTIEFWISPNQDYDEEAAGWYGGIGKEGQDYKLAWQGWTDGWTLDVYNAAASRRNTDTANEYLVTDEWSHVAGVWDGSTGYIYVNGILVNSAGQVTGAIRTSNEQLTIAEASAGFMNAIFDEVRISSTNRSVAWLLTGFNNQDSPSTFYSIETEETGGGLPNINIRSSSSLNCSLLKGD